MKKLQVICAGFVLGLIFNLHAQEAATQDGAVSSADAAQPVESLTDFQVALKALETVPPLPASEVPEETHGFYSAQNPDWPPLPADVLNLPIWPIGDGMFVLDDTNVNYVELQAESEEAAQAKAALQKITSSRSGGMSPMFSLISSPGGTPVYITNLVTAPDNNGSMTVTFSIAGGTNGFAYDIYATTNLAYSPIYSQWTWLGQGYTTNTYTFTNQSPGYTFYVLAIPRQTMVVAWGDDSSGQCDVPAGLTNAVDVAAGYDFSLALKSDGTVAAWGDNTYGETNVPAGLTNVAAIAAGYAHVLALLQNGTVVAWGADSYGQTNIPAGLTNVTAIAAGYAFSMALRNDGSVIAWGDNTYHQTNVPAMEPATQIAAGWFHCVALLTNGTVAAWGFNGADFGWNITNVPAGLSNVVSVAAGAYHSLALKTDGTVAAWGAGSTDSGFENYGQCIVPAGLSNVVAVDGGLLHSMALQADGTVVEWGSDTYGAADVPDRLTGVKSISGGGFYSMAVRSGSLTPVILAEPGDQYAPAGGTVTFYSEGAGLYGVTYQWQFDGVNIAGATGASLTLTNVQSANIGSYQVIISNSAGSVTSDNANFYLVTPPVITSQAPLPTNQIVIFQTNLTLSVTVTAPGQLNGFPLSCQWQLNGTNISGATSTNCSIFADTNSSGTYSIIVTNAAGSASAVWQVTMTYTGSYIAPGTLAYHLSTNAVGYANGYSGGGNDKFELSGWVYDLYSGTNMAHLTNSVWSTNFWLHGVQGLSATSIGISNSLGGQGLVTMVSPRHCVYATHMHVSPGYFMAAFLDSNNIIYWRTNMQSVDIGDDISVGILNADLPLSIGFLPVAPTNLASYLPTNSFSYVQGIGMNQDMNLFSQPMVFPYPAVSWNSSISAPYGLPVNWDIALRGGDSSGPERLLIANQLVLVSHNSGPTAGPNYAFQIDAINQLMHYLSTNNSVGTDYQITQFTLTNWPTIH